MKIRYGFVSNSSSGSYIVRMKNMTFDDFVGYILGAGLSYFTDEEIQENINNSINIWQEPDHFMLGLAESKVREFQAYLERSQNIQNDKERVQLVLDLEDIKTSEEGGDLLLSYYTIMHNDFNTGMNDLFKEIVLYFLFDLKREMYCERIDDSM